jgi:hypothetical protein
MKYAQIRLLKSCPVVEMHNADPSCSGAYQARFGEKLQYIKSVDKYLLK